MPWARWMWFTALRQKFEVVSKSHWFLYRFFIFSWVIALDAYWSGKKSKSVFDFLTYSRETGFSFSYAEAGNLHRPIGASNEIDRVSKFDNSLSFGTKQSALQQIFFALWFFKDLFTKNSNWFFFKFLWFCRINKQVYLGLVEHANTRNQVYKHSCSCVRVILIILAHLAH